MPVISERWIDNPGLVSVNSFKNRTKTYLLKIQASGESEEWEGQNTPLYYVPGLRSTWSMVRCITNMDQPLRYRHAVLARPQWGENPCYDFPLQVSRGSGLTALLHEPVSLSVHR